MSLELSSSLAKGLDLAATRKELSNAAHVPGAIYTSKEVLQLEIDRLFMKDWLYIGRVEELSKPGDYLTMRIAGEPIVVARAKDNNLNAYYNMCLHRGVEVAIGQGNRRSFSCPYHGWTYDLEGRLMAASHMKESEGFIPSECRMRPIRLDVWHGNIFISFSEETMPFQEFIKEFEKDFALLQMDKCRLADTIRIELNCNWKFVTENVMDFYHVNVLHAGSFGKKFSWINDDIVLKENGEYSLFYTSGQKGKDPVLGKMPWLADQDYNFACTGLARPNLSLFGRIDSVELLTAWPLAPDRCELVVHSLLPEEVFERPDIDEILEDRRKFSMQIFSEDVSMIESMQRAMSSPSYVPGRMSTQEKMLYHYLNGYLDRIFGPDLPVQTGAK